MGVCFIGERGNFGDFVCERARSASFAFIPPLQSRVSPFHLGVDDVPSLPLLALHSRRNLSPPHRTQLTPL